MTCRLSISTRRSHDGMAIGTSSGGKFPIAHTENTTHVALTGRTGQKNWSARYGQIGKRRTYRSLSLLLCPNNRTTCTSYPQGNSKAAVLKRLQRTVSPDCAVIVARELCRTTFPVDSADSVN